MKVEVSITRSSSPTFFPVLMGQDFTSKNLQRLFPTDQSMVVVIDDRQDVWGDCPNLVKVVPCKLSSYLHPIIIQNQADRR